MLRTLTECIAGPSRLPLRSCSRQFRPQSRSLSSTPIVRSGHNRWSKIRHKKGAVDAQRSAIFSRLTNVSHHPSNSSIYEREDDLRKRENNGKRLRIWKREEDADYTGNPSINETPSLTRSKCKPPLSSCITKSQRRGCTKIRR